MKKKLFHHLSKNDRRKMLKDEEFGDSLFKNMSVHILDGECNCESCENARKVNSLKAHVIMNTKYIAPHRNSWIGE